MLREREKEKENSGAVNCGGVYFNLDFGSMFNLDLIPKFGS